MGLDDRDRFISRKPLAVPPTEGTEGTRKINKSRFRETSTILSPNLRNQAKSSSPSSQASTNTYIEMVKPEFRLNLIIFMSIFGFLSLRNIKDG